MNCPYFRIALLGLCMLSVSAGSAQTLSRINTQVDSSHRMALQGDISPELISSQDEGPVPLSTPAGQMFLVLSQSAVQRTELGLLLDAQQDPSSPEYHHWLTPGQFATAFGVDTRDYETLANWLSSQGFTGIRLLPGGRVVSFKGTVGQVNDAFRTTVHKYSRDGRVFFANATSPSIPAAFAPVVQGIAGIEGIHPHRLSVLTAHLSFGSRGDATQPNLTQTQGGINYFLPDAGDAAVIYDTPNSALNPLYKGPSYDGTGITIGIAGDSNLSAQALSDIAAYRALFLNDPSGSHAPQVIVDGNDPGENSDEIEALTDIELAESVAPGASVKLYTSADTDFQSGLFLAMARAVDDNQVNILNVSFGDCEASLGPAYNALVNALWEQADAQGITVTVSSGDSGAAGCDDNQSIATHGLAVNGLASTPYNVSVGGTDFPSLFSAGGFSQYVSGANSSSDFQTGQGPYWITAKGYIPEEPWNDTTTTFGNLSANSLYSWGGEITTTHAGGGGESSTAYCAAGLSSNGACNGQLTGYPKPAFQVGATLPDGVRDIPDVSFFSGVVWNDGGYSPDFIASWSICSDNVVNQDTRQSYVDCQLSGGQPTSATTTSQIGGTSTSAPLFAGMLALLEQSLGGQRLGQVDRELYALEATHPEAFHDISSGNNSVPCQASSSGCDAGGFLTGFDAGAGYDLATGLGSVDLAKLISVWGDASLHTTTTSLQIGSSSSSLGSSPMTLTHGEPVSFTTAVSPASATGAVAFVTSVAGADTGSSVLLSNGSASGDGLYLPGGQYTLYARYGGDDLNAASLSNGIHVTVAPETSSLAFSTALFSAGSPYPSLGQRTSIPYGQYVFLQFQPYGQDGLGVGTAATGEVVLEQNAAPLTTVSLNSSGVGTYGLAPAMLSPGSYTWSANYSGDSSYGASSASASLTVTKGPTSVEINPSTSFTDTSGGNPVITITASTSSRGALPSGNVILYKDGKPYKTAALAAAPANADGTVNASAVFEVPLGDIGAGNSSTFYGVYGGDSNYEGGQSPDLSIKDPGPAFALSSGGNVSIAAPGDSGSSTISITPSSGFSGTVSLQCTVSGGPANAVNPPTCSVPSAAVISGSGSVSETLKVNTSASATAAVEPLNVPLLPAGGVVLGGLLLFFVPRRRRLLISSCLAILLICGITSCSSQGGMSGSSTGSTGSGSTGGTTTSTATTAGSYTVTVTGTSSGLNAVSTTVIVTVQ
jgi:hypothetical protein